MEWPKVVIFAMVVIPSYRADRKETPRWCWDQAPVGGQTAVRSTMPSLTVGHRALWIPQLRCGVEHGASLRHCIRRHSEPRRH